MSLPTFTSLIAFDDAHEARRRHMEKMDAVTRLATGLSRDVGTRIDAATAAVRELLGDVGAGHALEERLEDLRDTLQRAGTTLRQVRAFAEPSSAKASPIDVNGVLTKMRPLLPRLAGPFIAVTERLHPEGAWVAAGFGQLEQVILNLVVNARDAMPLGGTLELRTERRWLDLPEPHAHGAVPPGGWVVLEVADGGTGMDDDTRAHLFEPFFTTKEPGLGTGLGLATVYGIARQLGGQVAVRSAPGDGTTISVWLPAHADAPVTRRIEGPPEAILVVDDDEWVRTVTARILRRAGYGVLEADHGEAAIDLLRDVAGHCVRLVLTDVMMPGLPGHALAEILRRDHPEMAVILMSGHPAEALPAGVARDGGPLLAKPFAPEALLRLVHERLAH